MNPDDLASLIELMDLDLISASAAEVYQGQIADSGAGLGSTGPVEVRVVGDPAVPAGRYRLRQGRPVTASPLVSTGQPVMAAQPVMAGQPAMAGTPVMADPADAGPAVSAVIGGRRVPFNAHDGHTREERGGGRAAVTDLMTVTAEPVVPPLRLVTNGSVVETRLSEARAGRGSIAELMLPAEPTISRVHAKFMFTEGQWRITSLGRNGIMLNGVPVAGDCLVSDGDVIVWGKEPEALTSRVWIG
jgi:hypothetical protein